MQNNSELNIYFLDSLCTFINEDLIVNVGLVILSDYSFTIFCFIFCIFSNILIAVESKLNLLLIVVFEIIDSS